MMSAIYTLAIAAAAGIVYRDEGNSRAFKKIALVAAFSLGLTLFEMFKPGA